ncbi:PIN domain-containing protein [Sedimentitalea todarodis]|uniref:PIN domain-containing protein n=1 Tax=Sedimentitalea todarodis TaxID=1631240 RepID=A0ABU3VCZ5_9RHOB|nr:PIN domain-containing protein [Sedimentitalea todarodis]MDU9004037.1 PIN domain-containing protein [Sedimentitalea todarodis]
MADACVLASALKRNMLLSLAQAEFYRVRWSEKIMDETERTIEKLIKRKGIDNPKAGAQRQRNNMCTAFEDAKVEGFELLEPALLGINKKDRHVLAAAIKTSASVIVTDNLRDFPSDYCTKFDVEPLSADSFFADCISLSPSRTMATLRGMRKRLNNPEITPEKLITLCEVEAMGKTASLMYDSMANL